MNKFLHKYCVSRLFLLAAVLCSQESFSLMDSEASGVEIMRQVQTRHQQFPYIYEEQSMIMQDRHGDRDTRKARRYSKVEEDGTVRFLLLFDYPEEVKGVALLAARDPDGNTTKYLYLPALGERLIESTGAGSNDNFLGTDFSVENLTGEILSAHLYVRRSDEEIEGVKHFVLDVYKADDKEQILRRHFISEENLYITLTHHFDKQGRLSRIQSHHDLKAVDGDMWRANMILMEDKKQEHQSLIKVTRRVFSHDYVPAEVFTAEWLYANYPYVEPVSDPEPDDEVFEEVELVTGDDRQ